MLSLGSPHRNDAGSACSERCTMKFTIPLLALILILAACQPTTTPTETLPTIAVLDAVTAEVTEAQTVEAQTAEVTIEVTSESTVEATEAIISPDMPTDTAEPTNPATVTPRPVTPTQTIEPTQAAIGTATQAVLEAPRYATFTAAPLGTIPPTSSLKQVADVVINEQQFQEEVNLNLLTSSSMQSAVIDFVPGAIKVQMTTSGETPISGTVTIPVTLVNDLASITISDITSDQQPVPQSYVDVATGDLFTLMLETLDKIVKTRIGPQQKLKTMAVTDTAIEVVMLVP